MSLPLDDRAIFGGAGWNRTNVLIVMSDALETVSATAPNLEVGIRIELITSQCYGFAIHPLTIRATDQFLFTTALLVDSNHGCPSALKNPSSQRNRTVYQPLFTVHVKIEFVYLSDFSAFAFITEDAHLSLF